MRHVVLLLEYNFINKSQGQIRNVKSNSNLFFCSIYRYIVVELACKISTQLLENWKKNHNHFRFSDDNINLTVGGIMYQNSHYSVIYLWKYLPKFRYLWRSFCLSNQIWETIYVRYSVQSIGRSVAPLVSLHHLDMLKGLQLLKWVFFALWYFI